jgi:hypothetical protein
MVAAITFDAFGTFLVHGQPDRLGKKPGRLIQPLLDLFEQVVAVLGAQGRYLQNHAQLLENVTQSFPAILFSAKGVPKGHQGVGLHG